MLGLADAGDQCFPYNGAFISGPSRKKRHFPGSAGRLASGSCWQRQAWMEDFHGPGPAAVGVGGTDVALGAGSTKPIAS